MKSIFGTPFDHFLQNTVRAQSTALETRKDTQAKNSRINLPPSMPWRGPFVDIIGQTPNNKVLKH